MNIELSFFSILEVLTFSAALMLGLLFFTMKSANKKANIFLGLFLWFISLNTFIDLIKYEMTEGNIIDYILFVVSLFIAPLLYVYTYQTINRSYRKMLLYVFSPMFLVYVSVMFIPESEGILLFVDVIQYIFEIILYILILKKIKELTSELNNFYSELENKRLSWIKTIIYISLAFILFETIEMILDLDEEIVEPYLDSISILLAFIMVYWIAYNGFSQSEIFQASLFIPDSGNMSAPVPVDSKIKNEINVEEQSIFNEINAKITKKKLYADSELNLRTLSESLQVKEKELSRIINVYAETNFYHFINAFRVQEFKRLIQTPRAQQLSILGLAQEAGFSSKSTFYNTFKKLEGMTPKQYELSLKKSE